MTPSSNNRTDRARGDKPRGTRNIHTINFRAVRQYLSSVEAVARDKVSTDERVVVAALQVLDLQSSTVRELLGGGRKW
jgi:hypothetical protein